MPCRAVPCRAVSCPAVPCRVVAYAVSRRSLRAKARFRLQVISREVYGDTGTGFFRVLWLSPVRIILPLLHANLYLKVSVTRKANGQSWKLSRKVGSFENRKAWSRRVLSCLLDFKGLSNREKFY